MGKIAGVGGLSWPAQRWTSDGDNYFINGFKSTVLALFIGLGLKTTNYTEMWGGGGLSVTLALPKRKVWLCVNNTAQSL